MADAIYGRVQGAAYDETNEWWTLPCDQELNVTFKFGGQDFPVHPLDLNSNDLRATDAHGNPVCIGLVRIFVFIPVVLELTVPLSSNPSRPHSACSVNST